MTSRDFCYWLQGYLEITTHGGGAAPAVPSLDGPQLLCVQRHLAMVFKHEIDPSMGGAQHQATLSELHGPPTMRC